MTKVPYVSLNNGVHIPQVGLGVYQVPASEVYQNVKTALSLGYRHIDTASFYGNEVGVGKALRDANVKREEVFVTTKVWNDQQGYDQTKRAFAESLEKLGLEKLDLYLIHWPMPDTFVETWHALEELYEEGKVRAIGVSNFLTHHLEELFKQATIKPVINQIELHPRLVQQEVIDFCRTHDIAIQSWSPLGKAQYLEHPDLIAIAENHGKSPAQIILRWHVQQGFIVIPKSLHKERQKENISIFGFQLEEEEVKEISALNDGFRLGTHPDDIHKREF